MSCGERRYARRALAKSVMRALRLNIRMDIHMHSAVLWTPCESKDSLRLG